MLTTSVQSYLIILKKSFITFYQAWKLRQQGKKLREIAEIMGYKSKDSARRKISYVDFLINSKRVIPKKLKLLLEENSKGVK